MMQEIKKKGKSESRQASINEWLDFSVYVTKYRYNSYWHQLDEIFKSAPTNVLEIGVGSNVISNYLTYKGIDVVTLDLEAPLKPNVLGSVVHLPFKVLEHLPFSMFDLCLSELRRITKNKLILSLPDKTPGISFIVRIPNFVFWDVQIFSPWAIREPIRKVREHYWEIGRWGFPPKKIINHLKNAGFNFERNYRVPEYPYHHFFISAV